MLNELEMKYYLKDLEQRVQRSKSSAASQTTCGACTWVRSLLQATRGWLAPSPLASSPGQIAATHSAIDPHATTAAFAHECPEA